MLNNHFLFKFYSFEDKFLFILSNHLQSLFSSMNSTENRRVIEYVETILHFRFSLSLLHFSHLRQDATRKRTLERILLFISYIYLYIFSSPTEGSETFRRYWCSWRCCWWCTDRWSSSLLENPVSLPLLCPREIIALSRLGTGCLETRPDASPIRLEIIARISFSLNFSSSL